MESKWEDLEEYFCYVDFRQKEEDRAPAEGTDGDKDIEIGSFIVKTVGEMDAEKFSFNNYNLISLKAEALKEQIEKCDYLLNWLDKSGRYSTEIFKKYQPAITEVYEFWQAELTKLQARNEDQTGEAATAPPTAKTLSDYVTHTDSLKIVEGIKIQYKNIKGKRLKLLLLALQELNLLPKERFAQTFYNCCKAEFGWEIGSYNAMNGYYFNKHTDSKELNEMKQYLQNLIETK